ncbi:hypothetical protein E2C01_077217 [Portunus trituberculatus]|uniref:Uncharacterized protein n=1 Tax=Portunus trituberculatus TaxID=210409 RepID=A0A5B7IJN9_PORTR|nr:hypothetical protein [Portunus trituberculatus]
MEVLSEELMSFDFNFVLSLSLRGGAVRGSSLHGAVLFCGAVRVITNLALWKVGTDCNLTGWQRDAAVFIQACARRRDGQQVSRRCSLAGETCVRVSAQEVTSASQRSRIALNTITRMSLTFQPSLLSLPSTAVPSPRTDRRPAPRKERVDSDLYSLTPFSHRNCSEATEMIGQILMGDVLKWCRIHVHDKQSLELPKYMRKQGRLPELTTSPTRDSSLL